MTARAQPATNGAAVSIFERVEIVRIEGNQVADHWAIFGPWIMATMAHDLEPIDAVETMQRLRGDAFICLAAKIDGQPVGIAVCALSFLPAGKSMEVKALAGENFDIWIDRMWQSMRVAALAQGCEGVYLKGRMGWKKKLNRLGFKAKTITMEFKFNG